LTADLVAAAIVAAAHAYGDDPVLAVTGGYPAHRRCLMPAAAGLAQALGITRIRAAAMLGIHASNISRSQARDGALFEAALARVRASLPAPPEDPAALPPAPPVPPVPPAPSVEPETVAAPAPKPAPSAAPAGLRTLTAVAVRAALRDVLHTDNATAPELMTACRLSEGQVRQGLRELAEAGEVCADALTAEGWRAQYWRWVARS
jgi:hypothetical protein